MTSPMFVILVVGGGGGGWWHRSSFPEGGPTPPPGLNITGRQSSWPGLGTEKFNFLICEIIGPGGILVIRSVVFLNVCPTDFPSFYPNQFMLLHSIFDQHLYAHDFYFFIKYLAQVSNRGCVIFIRGSSAR